MNLPRWATWLLYAVLVDLADAVADRLHGSFERISLEMLDLGLYRFTRAANPGNASDGLDDFAAPENQDLGIVKVRRKQVPTLALSPVSGGAPTALTSPLTT